MRLGVKGEAERVRDRVERGDPFWPVQLAIGATIALYFALDDRVTPGPTWLLPAAEAVLLVASISIAPSRATTHSRRRRMAFLVLVAFASAVQLASLVLLVHYLVAGGAVGGGELIRSGAVLWATNILIYSVWFWELDAGGPVERFLHPDARPDFQFPLTGSPEIAPPDWRPAYSDYLYVALTNATAFSPTDTMPLTRDAKLLMATQSVSALLTVGLVIARAVNILG